MKENCKVILGCYNPMGNQYGSQKLVMTYGEPRKTNLSISLNNIVKFSKNVSKRAAQETQITVRRNQMILATFVYYFFQEATIFSR
jgi:hypothetical protein